MKKNNNQKKRCDFCEAPLKIEEGNNKIAMRCAIRSWWIGGRPPDCCNTCLLCDMLCLPLSRLLVGFPPPSRQTREIADVLILNVAVLRRAQMSKSEANAAQRCSASPTIAALRGWWQRRSSGRWVTAAISSAAVPNHCRRCTL